jgi:flavin reductase (DIM6/NTAB) family NADH-FMN oxidoreductase RutF
MSQETALQFRSLMARFVTGVTVIAVGHAETPAGVIGMTANAVSAVSLDPLLLLCCVRNQSSMLAHLGRGSLFSVNVLSSGQDAISRFYGGQPAQGERGLWKFDEGRAPVLQGANASFICEVSTCQRAGDHTVIFGAVKAMNAIEPPAPALVYACGKYAHIELAA